MPDLPDFVLTGSDVSTLRKLQSLFGQMATEEASTGFGQFASAVGDLMSQYADAIEASRPAPSPADDRLTDEQLRQWLYDAEYDWKSEDEDHWKLAMPSDTFPQYYSDEYAPTLAKLFREILESRGCNG